MYKTVSSIGDNIKIHETKNPKRILKLPEESHTPNRTYVTFYRNGKGLKEIAQYGPDARGLIRYIFRIIKVLDLIGTLGQVVVK